MIPRRARAAVDGAHLAELLDDFQAALSELAAIFEKDPGAWIRGKPGKWAAGQHAAHAAITLRLFSEPLEKQIEAERAGRLGDRPQRSLPEGLFAHFVIRKGWMPRGMPTIPAAVPAELPPREPTLASLRTEGERYRRIAASVPGGRADRIWVGTPFRKGFHYSLPEVVRLQAVHVRHHAALAREAARET
jgi:hypothetical protein